MGKKLWMCSINLCALNSGGEAHSCWFGNIGKWFNEEAVLKLL